MQYSRVEIELIQRGWSSGVPVAGAAAGKARGVVIDSSFTVSQTMVPRRQSHGQAAASALATSATARGVALVTRTARVRGPQGVVGTVSRVWVSRDTSSVTHILIRVPGSVLRVRPEYIVPVELLSVNGNALTTSIDSAKLKLLPIYRPDPAIAGDAHAALESALADPRARRAVKMRVEDGHVSLSGVLDTVEQVRYAERAVAAVAGVRGLTADLIAEESVATAVESRIAPLVAAAANGHGAIRVFSEHGIVFLEGTVVSSSSRSEIEREAIAVAGVRAVVNNLRIQGDTPGRGPGTGPLVRNR